jgi:hypothetical protein
MRWGSCNGAARDLLEKSVLRLTGRCGSKRRREVVFANRSSARPGSPFFSGAANGSGLRQPNPLSPLDLDDVRVVDDNLDRAEPKALKRAGDFLDHRVVPISASACSVLIVAMVTHAGFLERELQVGYVSGEAISMSGAAQLARAISLSDKKMTKCA